MKLLSAVISSFIVLLLVFSGVFTGLRVRAVGSSQAESAWASPNVMALKRIANVSGHQQEPIAISNLDCTLETYRLTSSSTMQTGCFTDTAFGQLDADSDVAIFNGTDEGVQLLPLTHNQVLAPWPKALDLVSLVPRSSGGSFLALYTNPLADMQDQRNLLGAVISKQFTKGPDMALKDLNGQQLIINPQSLAFSDNGSWLVAEVLGGRFVRINLASLQITPFAPIYSRIGSPALDVSSVTISPDGQYVAIENTYAKEFKVYDLTNCSGVLCRSYDYWPFISQQISSLMYISHVRFLNRGLISFDATANTTATGGTYELAPTAGIQHLIDYLGLGDSYSSGEGAFDYLAGSDTANNRCHLSSVSYPLLLTHDLYSAAGGHSVACSGAVMHDISDSSDNYRGQVKDVASWKDLSQSQPALLNSIMANYLPGYVAQQRFVSQYQPAVLTIGVGGNNMGFGNILERCIEPQSSLHVIANTCFATYEDRQELLGLVNKTGQGLAKTYKQIVKQAPASRIYIVGYPQVAVDNGDCAINVHFNTSELEFMVELVDQLNSAIANAAASAGVQYVDISQALAGHRLCETNSANTAVNGLTAGDNNGIGDFNFLGNESYHPNALGQKLIEQAILKQTHNLTTGQVPVAAKPISVLADAPKTGRTINQLLPARGLTSPWANPGQTLNLAVPSLSYGLIADSSYSVRLDGSQSTSIGTIRPDISTSLILPSTTAPGIHTIDVTGSNQAGEPVDISQTITITPNGGGGVCWPVIASGVDSDHDGIDDACDPLLGTTSGPSAGSSPPSAVSQSHGQSGNSNPITPITYPIQPASPANLESLKDIRVEAAPIKLPALKLASPNLTNQNSRLSAPLIQNSQPKPKPAILDNRTVKKPSWPALPIFPWLRWLLIICCLVGMQLVFYYWLKDRRRNSSLQLRSRV